MIRVEVWGEIVQGEFMGFLEWDGRGPRGKAPWLAIGPPKAGVAASLLSKIKVNFLI